MGNVKYNFKLTNLILGFLSWFAVNTAAWYMIWWLQPAIVNNTSSAVQKHFIDFWLNLLPWLIFLVVIVFLTIKRQWAAMTGWVTAALSNFVALILLLPILADTGAIPLIRQGWYLLFDIPVSALLIPNIVDLLYLWLL